MSSAAPASAVDRVKGWPAATKEYIDGLRAEMRRVTWPTKKQVQATTVVVIATVFAFAAFFAVVDQVLGWGVTSLQAYLTKVK
ncbi:MAG: preprotein translocase subunit SecE [Bryobacteraceae bacterium]